MLLLGNFSSTFNDRLNLLQKYNYDEMLQLMDEDAEGKEDERLKAFLRQSSELIRTNAVQRYLYCNWESVSLFIIPCLFSFLF